MRHHEPLCHPYDPFQEHPAIYSKLFLPAKYHISLRPFHIAQDLPLINQWLNFQFTQLKDPNPDPFRYTEDYYTTLLATANSQPLLGTINDKPAFEADIYQSMLGPDSLIEATSFTENDYIMQLMLSTETLVNLSSSLYALLACLDCFLTDDGIDSITWMASAGEKNARFIADMAGLDTIITEDNHQAFYTISKEKFKEIQYTLPLYPEQRPIALYY